jgi:hypothetical protein
MNTYARVSQINGADTVVEIITPPTIDGVQLPIGEMFTPEFVAGLIDVTDVSPQPEQWWTYNGTTFAAPQ